ETLLSVTHQSVPTQLFFISSLFFLFYPPKNPPPAINNIKTSPSFFSHMTKQPFHFST
ncbi:hypothetical protein NC653_037649, partial [Populus alba x Populus x berolinensis]